jgi:hypothetical protein
MNVSQNPPLLALHFQVGAIPYQGDHINLLFQRIFIPELAVVEFATGWILIKGAESEIR